MRVSIAISANTVRDLLERDNRQDRIVKSPRQDYLETSLLTKAQKKTTALPFLEF